jgi:hypothetical protein
MKWLLMLICLIGLLQPQTLYAHDLDVEILRARLICGGTKFFAESKFVELAPALQIITVKIGRNKPAIKVDLRQIKMSYPFELGAIKGIASFVSQWQCRKTLKGHVLVLWYACPQDLREDVPLAFCSSTREWERYVALDGSLLDRGFSFDDARYDQLRATLGYDMDPSHATDEGLFISIHR